jgi:lipopolysaccharide/colanic/teichoic acid biosynthesis glycosyltransferase
MKIKTPESDLSGATGPIAKTRENSQQASVEAQGPPKIEVKNQVFDLYFNLKYSSEKNSNELFDDFFSKFLATALLIISSPILMAVAIGVKISTPGNILYKQVRVGKNGREFSIYKFRSMITGAENSTGHTLSWDGDPRITKFGNFLRASHLDELPQLLNVVLGDMVFIGPRPERPEFTSKFETIYVNYNKRHEVKPGITGLAQITLEYDVEIEEKLRVDLIYIDNKDSLVLNGLITIFTINKMLFLKAFRKLNSILSKNITKYFQA